MAKIYGNRWRFTGDIGRGGQSDVFRVADESGQLGGEFALKRVRNPARHLRFTAEVEAIKKMRHPNIIELIDHSALENDPTNTNKQFIVMPIAQGGDLAERVAIYKDSLDSSIKVAKQLASALMTAHNAGIIHRDVKPQNVLFRGTGHDSVLTDFGICLISARLRATETDEVVGPWAFMAPELEGGGHLEVTSAADVYSLGKLIFYMISGGVVLPRERLHEDRYSSFFLKGERYTLLRVLIIKMISPLESRINEMKIVLSELDRIEAWEANARMAPLSTNAISALERIKQFEIQKHNATTIANQASERQAQTLAAVTASYLDWARVELENTATAIHVPGLLESIVRDVTFADNTKFNRGNHNYIVPLCSIEITIQRPRDLFKNIHALQLYLCKETKLRISLGDAFLPLPPEDIKLVFLPYYYRHEQRTQNPWKGFISTRSYLRSNRNHVSKSYIGGECTIRHEFKVSEWPGVLERLKTTLTEALEVFLDYVETGAKSLGG